MGEPQTSNGHIVEVVTRLVDDGLVRREHYGVACCDAGLAVELVRADRVITADQQLRVGSILSASISSLLRMTPNEFRYSGCGALERRLRLVAKAVGLQLQSA